MSDSQTTQDKTEQPTPKRLQQAKDKGQVPRSRELNTLAVMLAGALGLLAFGSWMMDRLLFLTVEGLGRADAAHMAPEQIATAFGDAALQALWLLVPLLGVLLVASLAGPALLGGLVLSADAARPQLKRLNPAAGLKRIFSAQGLMELGKTLLKFSVLMGIGVALLWNLADDLLYLAVTGVEQGMADAAAMIQLAFLVLVGGLLLVAAVDAPFQVWNHVKQLRMSRQEIKDEYKETEGSPEQKGRMRRMQQEMAGRRMMQDVPGADVVITNPTHYAVALKYSDRPDRAPRVVAKGSDLVAARIRDLAAEHAVPVCSAPPLARAIYFNTDIGQEIPAGLYLAVARVLAWVFQLPAARQSGGPTPEFPADLPIPDDLKRPDRTRT